MSPLLYVVFFSALICATVVSSKSPDQSADNSARKGGSKKQTEEIAILPSQLRKQTAISLLEQGSKFEGDMLITPELLEGFYGKKKASGDAESDEGKDRRGVATVPLWASATVPYRFASDVSEQNKATITEAMAAVSAVSCVKFVVRTTQTDFVEFRAATDGCYSYVGRVGGLQGINIQDDTPTSGGGYTTCRISGIVQHELLHALGFFHEQSRPDRDTYVTVNYNNIVQNAASNFDKMTSSQWKSNGFNSPYDFGSIMHYGAYSFSSNGSPTITSKSGSTDSLGQRNGLSAQDIFQLNQLYSCSAAPTTTTLSPSPTTTTTKASTSANTGSTTSAKTTIPATTTTTRLSGTLNVRVRSAGTSSGLLKSTSVPYVTVTAFTATSSSTKQTSNTSSSRGQFIWNSLLSYSSAAYTSFTLKIVDTKNVGKVYPTLRVTLDGPGPITFTFNGGASLSYLSFDFIFN